MKVFLNDGSVMESSKKKPKKKTPAMKSKGRGVSRIEKFTGRKIQELIAEVAALGRRIEYTSAIEPGVTLVIYPSGRCVWRHRVKGVAGVKPFHTIGTFPAISIDLAHEIARKRKARIAQGLPPDEEAEAPSQTVKGFLDDEFIPFGKKKYRNVKDLISRLNNWIIPLLGHLVLTAITKADVIKWHESIRDQRSAITANRCLSLLSSVFQRAYDLGLVEVNPCRGVKKFHEGGSRSRVLERGELQAFLAVLLTLVDAGNRSAQAVALALFTAKRRSEILRLTWSRINLTECYLEIPSSMAKNKRFTRTPLNSLAIDLLTKMHESRDRSTDYVFPSPKDPQKPMGEVRRTFNSLLQEAGIDHTTVRFHDLRRTAASQMINAGASIYEVKEVLSHTDIRSTQVYARLSRETSAKTAELNAQSLKALING